jgi:catechol 2,3-dioxygenase-like lactoylglutathione lyase family enzyme
MFININTVAIYVSDIERAKDFYIGALGFELRVDVHPNLCFLNLGDRNIYLEGGKEPVDVKENSVRISFFLEAKGSVFDVFNDLKEAGVEILQEEPDEVGEDTYTFQFKDPDGNILEVTGGS